MTLRDIPALVLAVWNVWHGHAERIAAPGKFIVWRNGRRGLVIELAA